MVRKTKQVGFEPVFEMSRSSIAERYKNDLLAKLLRLLLW